MRPALLAISLLAACAHHAGTTVAIVEPLPRLAIAPIGSRPAITLHGTATRIEHPPATAIDALPPGKRIVAVPDLSPASEPIVLDADANLRSLTNAGRAFVTPFAAPIAAYAPWTLARHAAILADGSIELVSGDTHYRFDNPAHFTLVTRNCFATADATQQPASIACFSKMPFANTGAVELVQDGTLASRPTRVEWDALATTSAALVDLWERALPSTSPIQISGASGRVCGVLADRTVACVDPATHAVARIAVADAEEIAVAPAFACARLRDHRVACWGDSGGGAFPLPHHPAHALPACPVDEAATERQYRERHARAVADAEACARSSCSPGTLDCHLGCVAPDLPRTPVYAKSSACTTTGELSGVEILDTTDAISIAATSRELCIVHARGYATCGAQ